MPNSKETHKNATPKAVIPESIRTLSKTNRNPVTLGYARVSTEQQNTDRQLNSLKEAKISDEHIFVDYASGKDFARSAFIALTKVLRPGDTLVISSLDRFGRSFELIPAQWFEICFSRHVNIRVLDNPLLNMENGTTRSAMDLLVQTLISLSTPTWQMKSATRSSNARPKVSQLPKNVVYALADHKEHCRNVSRKCSHSTMPKKSPAQPQPSSARCRPRRFTARHAK